jgi:hypothetical protein
VLFEFPKKLQILLETPTLLARIIKLNKHDVSISLISFPLPSVTNLCPGVGTKGNVIDWVGQGYCYWSRVTSN